MIPAEPWEDLSQGELTGEEERVLFGNSAQSLVGLVRNHDHPRISFSRQSPEESDSRCPVT